MGFLRKVESYMMQDEEPWGALELDLEDMYLNIDKEEVLEPSNYMLQNIGSEWRRAKRCRATTGVAVFKDDKGEDVLGNGSERYFTNVTIQSSKQFIA